ncbi:MAG: hypothetical protein ACD_39C02053G0001 [uncultured bacterium]|nr:MAG: hypothetical protein ACD_39C02053G0001 [uncultured bacterium]
MQRTVLFFGFLALGFKLFFFAETWIGRAVIEQATRVFLINFEALRLIIRAVRASNFGTFIPGHAEPFHVAQQAVNGLLGRALNIGIFDAQHKSAAGLTGIKPVKKSRTGSADVKITGWRRRKAHTNLL